MYIPVLYCINLHVYSCSNDKVRFSGLLVNIHVSSHDHSFVYAEQTLLNEELCFKLRTTHFVPFHCFF